MTKLHEGIEEIDLLDRKSKFSLSFMKIVRAMALPRTAIEHSITKEIQVPETCFTFF